MAVACVSSVEFLGDGKNHTFRQEGPMMGQSVKAGWQLKAIRCGLLLQVGSRQTQRGGSVLSQNIWANHRVALHL